MPSPIEEIKSRIDLVEFVHSYVRLQKSGVNFRGLCPFHSEKTPSFFVSPSRQTWHCFGGCGEGGDIFKFVMKIEGMEFPEALRLLAGRAGVVLRREDPAIRSERNRLYDLCETASTLFERCLEMVPEARAYLERRGLRQETVREFRIGFAPPGWDFLIKNLGRRGFAPHEIERAGLGIRSEQRNSWHDRFRSRIIFPIADTNGRVVGFGGRIFEPPTSNLQPPTSTSEAKYINTPQTLLYDKSRVLYGFDKAKHEIRARNRVVVVEGYMDCVMSHQAGVKNAVAVSGTALTSEQLKILRRLCGTIASSFDTDSAGDTATRRSLALAAQYEFERKIVAIPSGKDPADTAAADPEAWVQAVANAEDVVEFYFQKTFRDHDPQTAEGKKAITSMLFPFIRELANEVERAHWVGELARRLNIAEDAVWKEFVRSPAASSNLQSPTSGLQPSALGTTQRVDRRHLLEERLLILLTQTSADVRSRELESHRLRFSDAINQKLFEAFAAGTENELSGQPGIRERLALFSFKGEVLSLAQDSFDEELRLCKKELEKESLREELGRIGGEVQKSEREGRLDETGRLLREFQDASAELKELG